MHRLLTCPCGFPAGEPKPFHHGYTLSCEVCDTEGTYAFGTTRAGCALDWNERCAERYPEHITDDQVDRMLRGELTLAGALEENRQ